MCTCVYLFRDLPSSISLLRAPFVLRPLSSASPPRLAASPRQPAGPLSKQDMDVASHTHPPQDALFWRIASFQSTAYILASVRRTATLLRAEIECSHCVTVARSAGDRLHRSILRWLPRSEYQRLAMAESDWPSAHRDLTYESPRVQYPMDDADAESLCSCVGRLRSRGAQPSRVCLLRRLTSCECFRPR